MVLMTIESNKISKDKWGSSDWSNIIFITEVKENVDINVKDLWEQLGYMDNYVLRGPLIINEEKSKKIIENHAVLKDSLLTWIEQAKEEHKNEKGAFNPSIFISYSHADECYKDQLKAHLSLIKMNWTAGTIWDDRKLEFGSNYDIQIEKAIKDANIHILLISSDYFNSPYCRREFELICETNGIKIPIIVRDCYWRKVLDREALRYITLPENNSNIFASADKDREYSKIVEKIDEEINKLNNNE